MKKYIVDRIEENIVVLEDEETGEMLEVSKSDIKVDISTGDLLKLENDSYTDDTEGTLKRKKRIKNKFELLKSKAIEK